MRPLVVHDGLAAAICWVCVSGWLLGELAFMRRTGAADRQGRDLSTSLLTGAVLGGLGLGVLSAYELEGLTIDGPRWWPLVAGLVVLGSGLAVRIWAMRTLGRYFKYAVIVQDEHEVIETGPYGLIRHPSYTGMILACLGAGLALGNWLSAAIAGGLAFLGFTLRLLSEERVLCEQLGDPYRDYMHRTKRLLPGLW